MPRGTPDGKIETLAYATQITDTALVYQMLWGFSPVDGLGRMYYLDTFNNGTSGCNLETGAAGTLELNSQQAYSPPNSIHMTAFTDFAQVGRYAALGTNLSLGLEVGFSFPVIADLDLIIDYKPVGRTAYTAQLHYSKAAARWQIKIAGGTFVSITTPLLAASQIQQQIKIVGDWSRGKYKRMLIGDNLIDISAYALFVSALTNDSLAKNYFKITAVSGVSGEVYLGYILLTKDEP